MTDQPNLFTKEQWRQVMRIAAPHVTREEFDWHWAEFIARKRWGMLDGQPQHGRTDQHFVANP